MISDLCLGVINAIVNIAYWNILKKVNNKLLHRFLGLEIRICFVKICENFIKIIDIEVKEILPGYVYLKTCKMTTVTFAEDSNMVSVAPILSETVEKLDENANNHDYVMAFLITIMAESGYRVSSLYDENNKTWSKDMTCIPLNWKSSEKSVYEIEFLLYKRVEVGCKLIGIPCGDWLVVNLLPKGSSPRCKTRSMTVNVLKHVNMYNKELGKFWHLKELALRFKNNLLAPLHGEIMMEIGIASPSLQGLPHEIKILIVNMLDKKSRINLQKTCREFSNASHAFASHAC